MNAGTYYVYGGNRRYQQRKVLWNVRVDVREGASGVCTRPTLSTIEKYAVVLGAQVEIRARPRR